MNSATSKEGRLVFETIYDDELDNPPPPSPPPEGGKKKKKKPVEPVPETRMLVIRRELEACRMTLVFHDETPGNVDHLEPCYVALNIAPNPQVVEALAQAAAEEAERERAAAKIAKASNKKSGKEPSKGK